MNCTNCESPINIDCQHKDFCCDCFEIITYLIALRCKNKYSNKYYSNNINEFASIMDDTFEKFNIVYKENPQ